MRRLSAPRASNRTKAYRRGQEIRQHSKQEGALDMTKPTVEDCIEWLQHSVNRANISPRQEEMILAIIAQLLAAQGIVDDMQEIAEGPHESGRLRYIARESLAAWREATSEGKEKT